MNALTRAARDRINIYSEKLKYDEGTVGYGNPSITLVPTDFHPYNKKRKEKNILYIALPSNACTWRQFARHTYVIR